MSFEILTTIINSLILGMEIFREIRGWYCRRKKNEGKHPPHSLVFSFQLRIQGLFSRNYLYGNV